MLVLRKPGATASYKVYVVLDTDNEKGSDAVAVMRPAYGAGTFLSLQP